MNTKEAAAHIGVSEQKLRKLAKSGKIIYQKKKSKTGLIAFSYYKADLDEYLKNAIKKKTEHSEPEKVCEIVNEIRGKCLRIKNKIYRIE